MENSKENTSGSFRRTTTFFGCFLGRYFFCFGAVLAAGFLACSTTPPVEVDRVDIEEEPATSAATAKPRQVDEAKKMLLQGRAHLKAGNAKKALAFFNDGLEFDATQGLIHLEWSKAAQLLAVDPEVIWPHLQLAKQLLPNNPRVRFESGFFFESQGRYDEARTEYQQTLLLRKEHTDAQIRLAFLLLRAQNPEKALQHFLLAEKNAPNRSDVLTGIAEAAEAINDLDTAERALLKQVQLHPDLPVRQRQLLAFYQRCQQPKKAARVQRRLDKLDPKKKRKLRKLRKSKRGRKRRRKRQG
ncbi:MAG: tetratricopeptide repeat protein [Deltaproteobacteria bacterium]|nr:tetratricopeptide repeat protein [Deltaproteobacteria bacterium]